MTLQILSSRVMEDLGAQLARASKSGLLILLQGELGAGKTTLVRGFIRALGYDGPVKSPTYTLVEPYSLGKLSVYHFDFFRLSSPEELEYLGLREYVHERAICLVEWPERAKGFLPSADIRVEIRIQGHERSVDLIPISDTGRATVQNLNVNRVDGE